MAANNFILSFVKNLKDDIYEYADHASLEFHLRKNLGLGSHKGSGLPGETHMWPSTLSE